MGCGELSVQNSGLWIDDFPLPHFFAGSSPISELLPETISSALRRAKKSNKRVLNCRKSKNERRLGLKINKAMKKIIMIVFGAIFLTGIAMNLQYAFNDYGIKTNNLHTSVFATGTTWPDLTKKAFCKIVDKVPCDYSTNSSYISLIQYYGNQDYWNELGYSQCTFCDNICVNNVFFPPGNWACCAD